MINYLKKKGRIEIHRKVNVCKSKISEYRSPAFVLDIIFNLYTSYFNKLSRITEDILIEVRAYGWYGICLSH